MPPVFLLRGVVAETGLGCFPSPRLLFCVPTPRSVLDDFGVEDAIYLYVTSQEDVERYLEEREESSLLWVQHPGPRDGDGHVCFSTRLLGRPRHTLLPVKKAKVISTRRPDDVHIKDDPPYRILLPLRAISLVRQISGFLMPLLDQLEDDLQDCTAVAPSAGIAESPGFLEKHGTALFPTSQGVQLVRASNGSLRYGSLAVNVDKGQLELGMVENGQSSPRGNTCAVLGLKDALKSFQNAVDGEVTSGKRAVLTPSQWSSEAVNGAGSSATAMRRLAGADIKKRKEYVQDLLKQLQQQDTDKPALQHPDVLRSLLAVVSGCNAEVRPADYDLEILAQRAAKLLLEQLPRRGLALEKFMEGVCSRLQRGPVTDHLAVLRLLQYMLPFTSVTKAALQYGLVDVLAAVYGTLTTASLRPFRLAEADAAAMADAESQENGEHEEIITDLFTRSVKHTGPIPASTPGSTRRSVDRRSSRGFPDTRRLSSLQDKERSVHKRDTSDPSSDSSPAALENGDQPSSDRRVSKRPAFVPPLQLGAANLGQASTPKSSAVPGSSSRSLRLSLPNNTASPGPKPSATPALSPRSAWRQLGIAAGESAMGSSVAFFARMRRSLMQSNSTITPAQSEVTEQVSMINSPPHSPMPISPHLAARLSILNCLHLLSPLHTLLPEAMQGAIPRSPIEQELLAMCHYGTEWLTGSHNHMNGERHFCSTEMVQQWRDLALRVLHSYSVPVMRQLKRSNKAGSDASLPAGMQMEDINDSLLWGIDEMLQRCVEIQRPDAAGYTEAGAFVQLITSYLSASRSTRLPAAILHVCGKSLALYEHMLLRFGKVAYWQQPIVACMSSLLQLYTLLLQRAASQSVKRALVDLLLQRKQFTDLVTEFAKFALFNPTFQKAAGGQGAMPKLWQVIWQYYTAVAELLVAGIPSPQVATVVEPGSRGASPGPPSHRSLPISSDWALSDGTALSLSPHSVVLSTNTSARSTAAPAASEVTAADASAQLAPLLQYPGGLAEQFLLELSKQSATHERASHIYEDLQLQVLKFCKAALSIPGSPFLLEPKARDHYVNFHFRQFTGCYESLPISPSTLPRCLLHLQVLREMARHAEPGIRDEFYDLKVMDFITSELQRAEGPLPCTTIAHSDIYSYRPSMEVASKLSSVPTTPMSIAPIPSLGRHPIPSGRPHAPANHAPRPQDQPATSALSPISSHANPSTATTPAPSPAPATITKPSPGASLNTSFADWGDNPTAPPTATAATDVSTGQTPAPANAAASAATPPIVIATPVARRPAGASPIISPDSATPFPAAAKAPFKPPVIPPLALGPQPALNDDTAQQVSQAVKESPQADATPDVQPGSPAAIPDAESVDSVADSAQATPSSPTPAALGTTFNFCYDLEEDVERLLQLEEEMGHSVDLGGISRSTSAASSLSQLESPSCSTSSLPPSPFRTSSCPDSPSGSASPTRRRTPSPTRRPPTIPALRLGIVTKQGSGMAGTNSLASITSLPAGTPIPGTPLARAPTSDTTAQPDAPLPVSARNSSAPQQSPQPSARNATAAANAAASNPAPDSARCGASGVSNLPANALSRSPSQPVVVPRLNLNQSLSSLNHQNSGPTSSALQSAESSSSARHRRNPSYLSSAANNSFTQGGYPSPSPRSSTPPAATYFLPTDAIPTSLTPLFIPPHSSHSHNASANVAADQPPFTIHTSLHLLLLELLFELILTPQGSLDPRYCHRDPTAADGMSNILYILRCHLEKPNLAPLVAQLHQACCVIGAPATRLLRLLVPGLFRSTLYQSPRHIARGRNSFVFEAQMRVGGSMESVIIKEVSAPSSEVADNYTYHVFYEISILEQFTNHPEICQLLDYGISRSTHYGTNTATDAGGDTADADVGVSATAAGNSTISLSYWLVMKRYRCTLKTWREHQNQIGCDAACSRLYLRIFKDVVASVVKLAALNVVHYDLKCDNVLLEAVDGVSEEEFWAGLIAGSDKLAFRVVLGDFGESVMYPDPKDAYPDQSRGTEAFMSPEMLSMAPKDRLRQQRNFDRRKQHHTGFAPDVWSLGCLLFELLTNRLLFAGENQWVESKQQFRIDGALLASRVLNMDKDKPEWMTPWEKGLLDDHQPLVSFFAWLMVRQAATRPTLQDLQTALTRLLNSETEAAAAAAAEAEVAAAAVAAAEAEADAAAAAATAAAGAELKGQLEGEITATEEADHAVAAAVDVAEDAVADTASDVSGGSEAGATVAAEPLPFEPSGDPLGEAVIFESLLLSADAASRPRQWHISPALTLHDASFLASKLPDIRPLPPTVLLLTPLTPQKPSLPLANGGHHAVPPATVTPTPEALDPITFNTAQALATAGIPYQLVPIPPPDTTPTPDLLLAPLQILVQALATHQRTQHTVPSATQLLPLLPPSQPAPTAAAPPVILAASPDLLPQAALLVACYLLPSVQLNHPRAYLYMSKLGLTHLLRPLQIHALSCFAAARQRALANLAAPGQVLTTCLCGAFTGAISAPAASSPAVVQPRTCCCSSGDAPRDCPTDCQRQITRLQEQYGWDDAHLSWSTVGGKDFQWDPAAPLLSSAATPNGIDCPGSCGQEGRGAWALRHCACCGAPVFVQRGEAQEGGDFAVVMNWKLEKLG